MDALKMAVIITYREAQEILNYKEKEFEISLDLGKTKTGVRVEGKRVLIGNETISFRALTKIKENNCYLFEEEKLIPLAFFSDKTNIYYKLLPTKDWPTITFSSTPMHRHIKVSPKEDTELKITEISPIKGQVLDTCCGLGYTAIMASKQAKKIYTFERDANVLEMARYNPHSQELFENKKIFLVKKSIFEEIERFPKNFFDRVIHDPPTFTISPELYSPKFYSQLFRVMKKEAILYHYAPAPHKTKGEIFYLKIIRRLKEAGFRQIEYHEESSGIRAVK